MTPETAHSKQDFIPLIRAQAESGVVRDFSDCENYDKFRELARLLLKSLDDECGKIWPTFFKLIAWLVVDWFVIGNALEDHSWVAIIVMALLQYFPIVLFLELIRLQRVFSFYFSLHNLNNEAEAVGPEAQMDLQFLIGKLESLGDVFHTLVGRPHVQR